MPKEKRVFLDERHNFAEPSEARWLVIMTRDNNDKLIRETWLDLKARLSTPRKY